jgi:hypothetical protein
MPPRSLNEPKIEISTLIESYRLGFLHLDQKQIASIWDKHHVPLIYVAQEKEEPIQGWTAIEQYLVALPEHVDEMLAKHLDNVQIDVLGTTAIAFFISRSSVKLKGRSTIYNPIARVSMIFKLTEAGWQAIHYHESALSAQSAQVKSELIKG